jgi:hypothetical protein
MGEVSFRKDNTRQEPHSKILHIEPVTERRKNMLWEYNILDISILYFSFIHLGKHQESLNRIRCKVLWKRFYIFLDYCLWQWIFLSTPVGSFCRHPIFDITPNRFRGIDPPKMICQNVALNE